MTNANRRNITLNSRNNSSQSRDYGAHCTTYDLSRTGLSNSCGEKRRKATISYQLSRVRDKIKNSTSLCSMDVVKGED
jgi:hypothetical protein